MDGTDLVSIHTHSLRMEVVAEELDWGLVKQAFLCLEKQLVFAKPGEDLGDVANVTDDILIHSPDLSNVDDHKFLEEVPEYLVHEALEHGRGIG